MKKPSYDKLEKRIHELETELKSRKTQDRSMRILADAFLAAPDNIIITRIKDGKIIDANDFFFQISGFSREEALEKTTEQLAYWVESGERDKFVRKFRNSGEVVNYAAQFRIKDGSISDYIVSARPMKIDNEECIVSIAHNVSELRKAEKALRESEEKYQSLVEQTNQVTYSTDNEGRITYISPNILQYGYNYEEIVGKFFTDFIFPEDCEKATEVFQRRIVTGEEIPVQLRFFNKNDRIRWIEDNGNVQRNAEGEVIGMIGILHDITELKMTEEALLESREAQKTLLNATTDSAVLIDPDCNIIAINKIAAVRLGYEPEELIDKNIFEIMPKAVSDSRKSKRKALLQSKQPMRFEDERDGMIFDNSVVPVFNEKGELKHVAIFAQDITERKKAEEALRFTQFAVDHSADAAFWMDSDGRMIYVNDSACGSLGYTRQELLDMTVHDIDTDFPPDKWKDHWLTLMEKKMYVFESHHRKKNGSEFPVEITANFVEFEGKGYNCAFARNITNRKKVEKALFDSERKYRNLVEGTHDIIASLDADGKFTFINKVAEKVFGVPQYKCAGIHFLEFVCPGDRRDSSEKMNELINKQAPFGTIENRQMNKSGDTRDIHWTISFNYDEDGNYTGCTSIGRDITEQKKVERERKKLQEQLYQSQKMEAIGRLAGGVAHDFNNTLTGILGYAELLKLQYKNPESSEANAVDVIIKSAERAADLTRQLLGFAREGKYNPVPVNLNEIVIETNRMTEKSYSRNIRGHFELENKINIVEADRNQIQQVLRNLIINAKEFMPYGGDLFFETRNVFLNEDYTDKYSEFQSGHFVRISVTDTGPGIPKELHEKIFEPFFTTRKIGEGRGLGLATVFGIVKNHGGFLDVSSEVGEGTSFTIYLPVSEIKSNLKESPTAEEIASGSGETIFVVDDEENIRNLAKLQIQRLGYHVKSASDGEEAINIYRKMKDYIDLVLLDVIMPKMDGTQVYRELVKINPQVKVIVMSGFSKEGKAGDILKEGAAGFLQKPFKIVELSTSIKKALGK